MARRKSIEVVNPHVLAPLARLLQDMHTAPAHGNRSLFADHVLVAHLVAFLSPALKGLRQIESLFEHPKARERFGLPRVPKSTLSDAQAVFDLELATALIADLRQRVPALPQAPELDALLKTLIAVDGTFFSMAPRVAWALYAKPNGTPRQKRKKKQRGNIRMDLDFNVLTGLPEQATVTDGRTPEYRTLEDRLRADRFYVLDRAYHCYDTLAQIVEAGSDFLTRLRQDMTFEVLEQQALSAADRAAGVRLVQTVRASSVRGEKALGTLPLQLVEINGDDGKIVRLLTNRVDLTAQVIGVTYRHRWQIELFFRWLKCTVNFRHFFSESENGAALQIAAAIIGTLLIALITQGKPSSYDYSMMVQVMSGLLPLDEDTLAIMRRRRAERERAAAWQKEYNARRKNKPRQR
jgi:hypothetical protein